MAIVTKRENKRLEELKKLYNKADDTSISEKPIEVTSIEIPEAKVDRKDLYKDLIITAVIVLLSISGYLISRIA